VGVSTQEVYKNAVAQSMTASVSTNIPNVNMYAASINRADTPHGTLVQQAVVHFDASLSANDVSNYCHLLNGYLTTIGGVGAVC
jgi:hypothetical protein